MNIDEAFATMPDTDIVSENPDINYVIDTDQRIVLIPQHTIVLGVQGDVDINHVKFRLPRTYRGVDLTNFDVRVNYVNANGDKNFYVVKKSNYIAFTNCIYFEWVVASDAVAYSGDVSFAVVLIKTDGGKIIQEFNTTIATGKSLQGLAVDAEVTPEEREDLLSHFYTEVESYAQEKKNEIDSLTTENLAAIRNKGKETLNSIPGDYTTLKSDVEQLKTAIGSFRFEIDQEDNGLNIVYEV
nr:MAG TPA: BppU domain protein [Caudoviricetes sp.]